MLAGAGSGVNPTRGYFAGLLTPPPIMLSGTTSAGSRGFQRRVDPTGRCFVVSSPPPLIMSAGTTSARPRGFPRPIVDPTGRYFVVLSQPSPPAIAPLVGPSVSSSATATETAPRKTVHFDENYVTSHGFPLPKNSPGAAEVTAASLAAEVKAEKILGPLIKDCEELPLGSIKSDMEEFVSKLRTFMEWPGLTGVVKTHVYELAASLVVKVKESLARNKVCWLIQDRVDQLSDTNGPLDLSGVFADAPEMMVPVVQDILAGKYGESGNIISIDLSKMEYPGLTGEEKTHVYKLTVSLAVKVKESLARNKVFRLIQDRVDQLSDTNGHLDLSGVFADAPEMMVPVVQDIFAGKYGASGNIISIDLSKNKLTALPEGFWPLRRLQKLDLSDNQLTALPKDFWKLTALQKLDLSGNQLTTLPKSFWKLTALQWLDLSRNKFKTLPESIGQLTALQWLDLSRNKFKTLPESFGQLVALERLDLSRNKFKTLPESFGQLVALQVLVLDKNQLTALPESFGQLAALEKLGLSRNQFKALPESIGQLTALQMLFLYKNQLTALPKDFGQLTALQVLGLDENQLKALSEPLEELKQQVPDLQTIGQ